MIDEIPKMYTGLTQTSGTCPICKKKFPKGTLVYFDSSKSDGNNLVHKECLDTLLAERGEGYIKSSSREVKSHVSLDAPF